MTIKESPPEYADWDAIHPDDVRRAEEEQVEHIAAMISQMLHSEQMIPHVNLDIHFRSIRITIEKIHVYTPYDRVKYISGKIVNVLIIHPFKLFGILSILSRLR